MKSKTIFPDADELLFGLNCVIGKNEKGDPVKLDFIKTPDVLLFGVTGAGKSSMLHAVIVSLLGKYPSEFMKVLLIDGKGTEFSLYSDLDGVIGAKPFIEQAEIITAIKNVSEEIERRVGLFTAKGFQNIEEFNRLANRCNTDFMRKIVVVIDDLCSVPYINEEFARAFVNILQKGGKVGVCVVAATQAPEFLGDRVVGNFGLNIALAVKTGAYGNVEEYLARLSDETEFFTPLRYDSKELLARIGLIGSVSKIDTFIRYE